MGNSGFFPFLSTLINIGKERIVFIYDFENFYNSSYYKTKLHEFISKAGEKFALIHADKIIHKGLENELEFLPFYDKIKDKPHYLFREFLYGLPIYDYDPNIKLSKKDGKIHLVYVGGFYFRDQPDSYSLYKIFRDMIEKNKNVVIHIYSKISYKYENEFYDWVKNNNRIFYEGYLDESELIKDLRKYDFGLDVFYGKKESILAKVAFSNKLYNYIAASLPIIVSSNLYAKAKLVTALNIGIILKDVKNINNIRINNNYNANTEKFNSLKQTNVFLNFIE